MFRSNATAFDQSRTRMFSFTIVAMTALALIVAGCGGGGSTAPGPPGATLPPYHRHRILRSMHYRMRIAV